MLEDGDAALRRELSAARRALSPEAGAELRVLAKVEAKLGFAGSSAEAATGREPVRPERSGSGTFPRAASAKVFSSKLSALVLVLGGGALVHTLGTPASTGERPAVERVALEVAPAVERSPALVHDEVPADDSNELDVTLLRDEPPSATPAREEQTATRAAPPLRRPRAQRQARASAPPAEEPSMTLQAELEALAAAQHALQRDEPARALALLTQLERRVVAGRLEQERDALRTRARCALEPAARVSLLAAFSQRHPNSVYLARLEKECASAP